MFADLGETELRGFEDPVRLVEFANPGDVDVATALRDD